MSCGLLLLIAELIRNRVAQNYAQMGGWCDVMMSDEQIRVLLLLGSLLWHTESTELRVVFSKFA